MTLGFKFKLLPRREGVFKFSFALNEFTTLRFAKGGSGKLRDPDLNVKK
jgi:hypothetical protein